MTDTPIAFVTGGIGAARVSALAHAVTLIAFLPSPGADDITGATVAIDGALPHTGARA